MPAFRFFRFIAITLCAGALAGVLGCTPPVTEVSGTIKINGKPPKMKGLEVVFMSSEGRQASAPINLDGTYETKDAPSGKVLVSFAFMPEVKGGGEASKSRMSKPGAAEPVGTSSTQGKNPIPTVLREASTSKISTTFVTGEKNVFDYDMKP
jgi:hypothetical protein